MSWPRPAFKLPRSKTCTSGCRWKSCAPRSSLSQKVIHRLDEQSRLIHEVHMAALREDHQLRAGDESMHILGERGREFVMIAGRNQRGHFNRLQAVRIKTIKVPTLI